MRARESIWIRLAPALVVAALGWQIGERAWRVPPALPLASSGLPQSLPPVVLLPSLAPDLLWPGGNPTGRSPAHGSPPSPPAPLSQFWERGARGVRADRYGQKTSAAPIGPPAPAQLADAAAGQRAAPLTGPVIPYTLGYDRRPLPLPSPDQVQFLLRREPVAALRPASPLTIAPGATNRPTTNNQRPAAGRALPSRLVMGPRRPMGPPAPGGTGKEEAGAVPPSPGPAELPARSGGEAVAGGGADRPPVAPGGETPPAAAASPALASGAAAESRQGADPRPGAFETAGHAPKGDGAGAGAEEGRGNEPAAPALHLDLQVVAGRARTGTATVASVRIVASAPCHLAAYQVDATGRVTPLLPATGAARMPAATSFRLATRPRTGDKVRVVVLASRQPLSARALYRCLLAFLAEAGGAPPPGSKAGGTGESEAERTAALSAVSTYLARQVGIGAASDPLPDRPLWAAGVSPLCLPATPPSSKG